MAQGGEGKGLLPEDLSGNRERPAVSMTGASSPLLLSSWTPADSATPQGARWSWECGLPWLPRT